MLNEVSHYIRCNRASLVLLVIPFLIFLVPIRVSRKHEVGPSAVVADIADGALPLFASIIAS